MEHPAQTAGRVFSVEREAPALVPSIFKLRDEGGAGLRARRNGEAKAHEVIDDRAGLGEVAVPAKAHGVEGEPDAGHALRR